MRFDGRHTPAEAIRASLDTNGWVVLTKLVPEVAIYRAAFDSIINRYDPVPCNLVQLTHARELSEVYRRYLEAPFWEIVREILNVRALQLLQDVLLYKPAGSMTPITWHTDYSYTCFLEPDHVYSVRLSLSHATRAAGCLEVIEGSHRWPLEITERVLEDSLGESVMKHLPPALQKKAGRSRKAVILEAGDLSIHHCRLLHGSFENTTDTAQQVLVHHVFDSQCRLKPDALPPGAAAHFPADEGRHLHPAAFPILASSRA